MTEYKKIFIDTSPFIYLLEKNANFYDKTKNIFSYCINNNIKLVTSVITIEEYLIYPYRMKNDDLVNKFFSFINDIHFDVITINKDIAITAAKLRAIYKDFKGMDCLQLAAAITSGSDLFITNDKQLRLVNEINAIVIDEWRN